MAHEGLAAVLWDMDGTLIDSEPVWIRSQSRLVAQFGGFWTYQDGLTLVGVSMEDTAHALGEAGVTLTNAEIILRLAQEVTGSLELEVPWRPGAHELVEALWMADVPQAIVTSAPLSVAQCVANALPAGAIRAIVADEHVENSKPHPEPYLTAARVLDASPSDCVAIEDSPAGLASAIAAGVSAIGVPRDTDLGPDGAWVRLYSLEGVGVDDLSQIARRRTTKC